jgi:hypothetical protein
MLLTTAGVSIYLSTPAGKGNVFANTFLNTDGKYNSFTRFSIGSREAIQKRELCETWSIFQRDKALEYLERERSRMSMLEYAQEYEGQLIDELRQFFPTDLIKKCMEYHRIEHLISNKCWAGVDVARMGGDEFVIASLDESPQHILYMVALEVYTKITLT